MDKTKLQEDNVISFQNEFNYISPADLESIMESLDDADYLSNKGKKFRYAFWELFIKKIK